MKYADINTLSLIDVGGLSNYDLIGFHDLMKDSQQSIADEFFNKLHKKVSSDNLKDANIYDELYEVIKKDVWGKIYSSLKNSEDTEDILL